MEEPKHEIIIIGKINEKSVQKDMLEIACKKLLIKILNYYGRQEGRKE